MIERKSQGQLDYERSVANEPKYHDGTPRKTWYELDPLEQWSWEREPRSEQSA